MVLPTSPKCWKVDNLTDVSAHMTDFEAAEIEWHIIWSMLFVE